MSTTIVKFPAALLLALLPALGFAQAQAPSPTGAVTGRVRDSLGGAIPGAVIRVVNESTNVAVQAVSSDQGTYEVTGLAPGTYRLEANLDGFETATGRFTILTGQTATLDVILLPSRISQTVVVTARRTEEAVQDVPIPVSVVGGDLVADAGAFNVNRLKEIVPTVQFYSTNPRNSAINIRGLGAPFGLTNDGLEPGVGLYIDGVFYARPAAATLDFLDVERIEVLRGPQGTLFGKNTTAGAINVTTRKPSFTPQGDFELNYGNYGYVQAKASITGPITKKIAGRLSFSGTQRDGFIFNVAKQDDVNDLNNLGIRGQVLATVSDGLILTVAADNTRQRPEGYTQVIAGVAPTLRAANRQWDAIASDLEYTPPSYNVFDRVTDIDTPLRSSQDMGGASANADWKVGRGLVTATVAWRYWNWDPSNDRDFIGLAVTPISAAPSKQDQWTQEVRYAGDISPRLNVVFGVFNFRQGINSNPSFRQEQGAAAWRFLLTPNAAAATPGLLDGYGYDQFVDFSTVSSAAFGQLEWHVTDRLRILPGLRFNYDKKQVDFDQQIYGGLQTSNAALIALQRSVLAPQTYAANVAKNDVSGQFTVAYKASERAHAFATYAKSFKSVGLNLNGVPTDANNDPVLSAATVKPESVHHLEAGVKTEPVPGVTFNVTAFDTTIRDFQAQVVNANVGVLRGYLANAEKVRVRGVEFEGNARVGRHVSLYGAGAYTDGKYVSFTDAPPPLEDTGGPQVKDISGSLLPGISKWALSLGGEVSAPGTFLGSTGVFFAAADASHRSSFSSSPSASTYLVVDGYALLNTRVGFRWSDGWQIFLWARNVLDKDYVELLTAAPGNSGLFVGQPGDPRTAGITLRVTIGTARN